MLKCVVTQDGKMYVLYHGRGLEMNPFFFLNMLTASGGLDTSVLLHSFP